MPPTSDDNLAAAVFALGLTFGFVRREDVVRWADRRIMEIDRPPAWLIDLSLSQDWNVQDVISRLEEVGKGTDPEAVFRTLLGLIPEVKPMSFDAAETLAKHIYDIARHCIGDCHNRLLYEADHVEDTFKLQRSGYCMLTGQEVVDQLAKFVADNRDERRLGVLCPATWAAPLPTSGQTSHRYDLIHVGLSSWIVQDGNYEDFAVGQKARFALEFYPPHGLALAHDGPPTAEHVRASRYRVRARVVFADANVWIINAGRFMAFYEQQPPEYASAGAWVAGEIYLGIDPFFYFEYLHRVAGMPPLTYSWIVREIARDTTPWIEARDEQGRAYRTRDESRQAFEQARQTKAWDDDGGSAHYVLGCQRVGGPERP